MVDELPPWFGLDGLDRHLADHLTASRGVFVELGAFDGVTQSNTLHFEMKGWRGVLIEPSPTAFARCVANRPLAQVFNCACVPFGTEGEVHLLDVKLMSMVTGAMGAGSAENDWIQRGEGFAGRAAFEVTVPARTLTSVLEEAGVATVDFLSLDVEWFEVPVLEGLDFARFGPRWICGEDNYEDGLRQWLEVRGYEVAAILSERRYTRDLLYRREST